MITEYSFDTAPYLRLLDRCLAAGITATVVPGIMPVSNYAQAARFSAMCGASVPAWLGETFEGTEDNPETRRMVASVAAAAQVRTLQANRVDEFHFYTLTRPKLTDATAHILGDRAGGVAMTPCAAGARRNATSAAVTIRDPQATDDGFLKFGPCGLQTTFHGCSPAPG